MSRKKSKTEAAEKPQKKADPPPPVKADPTIRRLIRKEIRSVCEKGERIDKDAIKVLFTAQNPDHGEYIDVVVDAYAAHIEEKYAKKEAPSSANPPSSKANGTSQTPSPAPKGQKTAKKAGKKAKAGDGVVAQQKKINHTELQMNEDRESQSDNAILKEFREHLAINDGGSSLDKKAASNRTVKMPSLQDQMQFLNKNTVKEEVDRESFSKNLENAVLISPSLERQGHTMPSQYGLLGHLDSRESARTSKSKDQSDPRVMLNTNIPFSAFICGLQGSGKSHTTACMIENCSLAFPALGSLKKPVSTLVLNYNEYSSNASSQPSEAAFLASIMPEYSTKQQSIPVRVLVSPTNFHNLGKMYSQIPNVTVQPFRLHPRHLNISMMLSLMSMGKGDSMPLYMAQVTRVLREMAIESGGHFDYAGFRRRLNDLRLDRAQTPFLFQRLDLLDSYLDLDGKSEGDYFVDSGVTILDLSCPFVDENTSCILFRIAIDLFLYAHSSRGKMIIADEAHKYMTDTPAAKELTETFLNIIRQQRHLGVRTIISTQEPTISPRLIDLCTMTVIHRFSSPEWYRAIRKHVPLDNRPGGDDGDALDGLYQISSLRTGEALVFAPSAHLLNEDQSEMDTKHGAFKMVVRKRVTWDGGRTIVSIR
ncbi:hypothetical protein FE257_004408 [Aspergillus nanangensis]|uniref:Uncharacterized protein n=1 Tax=Aspergillus nanangensis TaxID=2582783 RepID=A0AAD4CYC6_ASPNN|nr:hypothetical protein FE257_004408 [Aspergillus nanangensis]